MYLGATLYSLSDFFYICMIGLAFGVCVEMFMLTLGILYDGGEARDGQQRLVIFKP